MTQIVKQKPSIESIEKKMFEMEQAECPVVHSFAPGLYIRELRMKAGTLAIGHYQKTRHLNLFLKGRIIMIKPDGTRKELVAPMMFVAEPGKKMGHVIEDVVWLNIYATEETDIETLEEMYFKKSDWWKEKPNKQAKRITDREDFQKVLSETGFSEEQAIQQSENTEDQIPMPNGSFKIQISESNISGRGVFATAGIEENETIGPARIDGKRTPIGRYCNHSMTPNAKMKSVNGNIFLVSIGKIKGCRGGLVGEEITTDYRENLKVA